jgi:hypothetical protein
MLEMEMLSEVDGPQAPLTESTDEVIFIVHHPAEEGIPRFALMSLNLTQGLPVAFTGTERLLVYGSAIGTDEHEGQHSPVLNLIHL